MQIVKGFGKSSRTPKLICVLSLRQYSQNQQYQVTQIQKSHHELSASTEKIIPCHQWDHFGHNTWDEIQVEMFNSIADGVVAWCQPTPRFLTVF